MSLPAGGVVLHGNHDGPGAHGSLHGLLGRQRKLEHAVLAQKLVAVEFDHVGQRLELVVGNEEAAKLVRNALEVLHASWNTKKKKKMMMMMNEEVNQRKRREEEEKEKKKKKK